MPPGYDYSSQVPFRLLQGRLGIYGNKPFESQAAPVDGIVNQANRFRQAGGNR